MKPSFFLGIAAGTMVTAAAVTAIAMTRPAMVTRLSHEGNRFLKRTQGIVENQY